MSIFLETKRLILKKHKLSDFDNLLALRSDPDVMKYIGDGSIHTEERVRRFLTIAIPYQEKHGIGFCAVFEKASGNFIGQAGLFHIGYFDEQPEIEIAYRLHKTYWGKGYATELVKALIQWGFQHLSVNKLIAVAHPDNIASQKVLKKAGLDYKGKKKWHDDREVCWYEIYKNDSVQLFPYETQWAMMAELEIKKLLEILPAAHILDIQHVGSTAIPGMLAKPVIDIQIAVDSLTAIKQVAIDRLKTQEYVYWDENPDPERMFFTKGMPPFGEKRTHHVHIVEPASQHWQGKILFRDYLIAHPDIAHEYEKLKIELAQQYTYDREQYTQAKTEFINAILHKARSDTAKHSPAIVFLTGASGAGKTTLLNIFSRKLPAASSVCLHFDSIGVPDEKDMIAVYGSGSEWQKAMTYHWIKKLLQDYHDKKLIILEGQVNLDFIVSGFAGFNIHDYKIVLLHCENTVRHKRLQQDRHQPELINDTMDTWADFLKKQAIDRQAMILDTTLLNSDEMISEFESLMGRDNEPRYTEEFDKIKKGHCNMIKWSQKNFSELTKEKLYAILKHRMEIFILEQKSFYLDLDNMDQQATHFLGEEEGKLVAYARVYIDNLHRYAEIRRVAIHKDFRKKQLGTLLLTKMLDFIASWPNITTIELDAQHHLQQFYARQGFFPVGEPYQDGNVLHIKMIKTI